MPDHDGCHTKSRTCRVIVQQTEDVGCVGVYTELFLTPANDPWLGMATPGIFTALPGDGVRVQ